MSALENINELPKLSEPDLWTIREVPLDIASENADVALCNQAALDGALMLDRMEEEDAHRSPGQVWMTCPWSLQPAGSFSTLRASATEKEWWWSRTIGR